MLKRALFFSTPYRLSLKDNQLVVSTKEMPDMKKTIPIEDIGYVVLEHQQTSITLPLLNALSDNNVAVIICGENRMPNAMLMNLDSNTTQGESYRQQIDASEPLKKNLWKQVVEAKIRNQAALLRKLGKDGDKLKPYYSNVKSGDSDNREGVAAKIYWRELFGEDFILDKEHIEEILSLPEQERKRYYTEARKMLDELQKDPRYTSIPSWKPARRTPSTKLKNFNIKLFSDSKEQ